MKKLSLVKITYKAWDGKEPNMYVDRRILIDGVWASKCLEVGRINILPFSLSIGNHCTVIFDISSRDHC